MSKEWMFSWILTVKNDDEWMRTRKATLILKDLIETMGDVFKETYLPLVRREVVPAELTYIMVIGNSSKLELEESDESCSGLIDLPIRGYLAANPGR